MEKENAEAAEFANSDMFRITEQMESGMDPTKFYNELRQARAKIIKMVEEQQVLTE